MFKGVLASILILTVFFESYKHSVSRNFLQITSNQRHSYFSEAHHLYIFFIVFFCNKLINWDKTSVMLFVFFAVSVIIFNRYTGDVYKHLSNILVVLITIMWASLGTKNVAIFIITAELLSMVMFFVLFFSNGFYTANLSQGVFYFLVGNILTFLFGVLFLIVLLCCYGTLNIDSVAALSDIHKNNFIALLFTMYLLLKLGQGPAIFFKFRFYKSAALMNLVYYIFTYIIMIWPFLFLTMARFDAIITPLTSALILFTITLYLVQSIFFFTGVIDFVVFSTWAFIWYMVVYTII